MIVRFSSSNASLYEIFNILGMCCFLDILLYYKNSLKIGLRRSVQKVVVIRRCERKQVQMKLNRYKQTLFLWCLDPISLFCLDEGIGTIFSSLVSSQTRKSSKTSL